jgi:hypothetical protein
MTWRFFLFGSLDPIPCANGCVIRRRQPTLKRPGYEPAALAHGIKAGLWDALQSLFLSLPPCPFNDFAWRRFRGGFLAELDLSRFRVSTMRVRLVPASRYWVNGAVRGHEFRLAKRPPHTIVWPCFGQICIACLAVS